MRCERQTGPCRTGGNARGWMLGVWLAAALLWLPFAGLAADARKLKVTTTVGMVTDMVREIGGDRVEVTGLMGPGVDPHLYKATASDLVKLQRADVILYSGLHLEGKMQEIFEKLAKSGRKVRAITEAIPRNRLLRPEEFEGQFDPHVWFDVELWALCADPVAQALGDAMPEAKEDFANRAAALKVRLAALHRWARDRAASLPESQRVLVSSHDAFNYFGRAYGFKVVALQGVSTVTEAGLADMAKLIDFIKAQKVRAVFVESSVPHGTIERISRDAGVKIGGELFSDALGTPGEKHDGHDLGTYEGMIRHNMDLIVEALK
jgi:manganese/zinc/iron transport system substrate-binding protein